MQKLDPNQKFVIWGYTLNSHTHSYIHYGFFKALKSLGYDVRWFDDININEDFENCIFISEANCSKNIPIVKSSKYFIHNLYDGFQNQTLIDHQNIYNLLVYHEEYNFPDNLLSLDDYSWYDSETKTIMIMWGTDLLPNEIDKIEPVFYDKSKSDVNFIGTIQGENSVTFAHICADHGKNFYNLGGYTGSSQNDNIQFYDNVESINVLRKSYLSFDIRESQHLRNGYIPCRIFKNISYGMWTGSNSPKIKKFFEGHLTIDENLSQLYDNLVSEYSSCSEDRIRNSMNYVRDNHTYLNRIQSLLSVL
jgi:hypothetical protein